MRNLAYRARLSLRSVASRVDADQRLQVALGSRLLHQLDELRTARQGFELVAGGSHEVQDHDVAFGRAVETLADHALLGEDRVPLLESAPQRGEVTDVKTIIGAFWLEKIVAGSWQPA